MEGSEKGSITLNGAIGLTIYGLGVKDLYTHSHSARSQLLVCATAINVF